MLGVYVYWGNLQIVSGIIFQMTVCFVGLVILVYFTYNRKYLLEIFELLRTEFVPYINKVGSTSKQEEIMKEKTKFASRLTTILIIIFFVVMSAWSVFPFFVKYWSYEKETEIANFTEAGEGFVYFVIATWIPDNAFSFPTYEIIYACQFFYIWSVVAHFTIGNMVFSSIYYGISLHFRLLASAIREIDDIFIDLKENLPQEDNNYSEGTKLASLDSVTGAYQRVALEEVTPLPKDTSPVKFLHKEMSVGAYRGESTNCGKRTSCNETVYIIECINYHQRLLK
ncbi:hypothetical protein B7P43_G03324 [Cryptotermes secundus]|uniref:Odorant receptor n=1 Tax=Cryptotermes secundus TaxID=105785 RepID=A0A2J7PP33_9NEOP|nr:hypothetical protein B7P43_G03324 [Cryptotermes secundus]